MYGLSLAVTALRCAAFARCVGSLTPLSFSFVDIVGSAIFDFRHSFW